MLPDAHHAIFNLTQEQRHKLVFSAVANVFIVFNQHPNTYIYRGGREAQSGGLQQSSVILKVKWPTVRSQNVPKYSHIYSLHHIVHQ